MKLEITYFAENVQYFSEIFDDLERGPEFRQYYTKCLKVGVRRKTLEPTRRSRIRSAAKIAEWFRNFLFKNTTGGHRRLTLANISKKRSFSALSWPEMDRSEDIARLRRLQ